MRKIKTLSTLILAASLGLAAATPVLAADDDRQNRRDRVFNKLDRNDDARIGPRERRFAKQRAYNRHGDRHDRHAYKQRKHARKHYKRHGNGHAYGHYKNRPRVNVHNHVYQTSGYGYAYAAPYDYDLGRHLIHHVGHRLIDRIDLH